MADILAFNLTQTRTDLGSFKPRQMNNPDLSTKLKLMGVDVSHCSTPKERSTYLWNQVASFGDFFADKSVQAKGNQSRADRVTSSEKLAGMYTSSCVKISPDSVSVPLVKRKSGEIQKAPVWEIDKGQRTGATVYDSTSMPPITGTSFPIIVSSTYRIVEINMGPRRQPHVPKTNIAEEPIKCLTYKDPFASVYKK
jgi:nitrite reductase (NAD(P)H)